MAYVLKVKYENTLRRMIVKPNPWTVNPNPLTGEAELSYAKLVQKIRNLFKIPSDGELVLTYKDRENDVVTISEDEDLEDALLIQGLNPLRIDVKNGKDKRGTNKGENGEGTSDDKKDAEARSSSAKENLSLADMLEKTLLPTLDALKNMASGQLSNFSERLEQDGTLHAKLLSEFLQVLTKASFKDSKGKSNSEDQDLEFPSSPKEAAGSKESDSSDAAADFSQIAKDQVTPNPCEASFHGHRRHHADGVFHHGVQCDLCGEAPIAGPRYKSNKKENYDLCLNCFMGAREPESDYTRYDQPLKHYAGQNLSSTFHHGVQCDLCGVLPIAGPRYKSIKKKNYDLCLNCFIGTRASESDYTRYDQPLKHYAGQNLSSFHWGKTPRCPYFQPHVFGRPGFGNRGHRAFNHNGLLGKLDCRFVRDVSIFDGTELAPGTSFRKSWRLRNSGNISWPKNTLLVHVGGDELGSNPIASLELPNGGLPPDGEIEASVDLTAPENAGRYISHWRLMAPSGVKFGHKVWVSIQVVSKYEQSPQILEFLKSDTQQNHQPTSGEALYEDGGVVVEEILEKAFMESMSSSSHSNSCIDVKVEGPSAPLVDLVDGEVQNNAEADSDKYLQESFLNENPKMESSELGAFSLVDLPNDSVVSNASVTAKSPSNAVSEISYSQAELHPSSKKVESFADPAFTGLNQLAAMGFTDRSLNLELLEKNDYNLQHVLDELFSAADWEHLLDELQEMGFTDVDLNRRLMFRNNGSLKRVVKELVQIYRASATQNKENA